MSANQRFASRRSRCLVSFLHRLFATLCQLLLIGKDYLVVSFFDAITRWEWENELNNTFIFYLVRYLAILHPLRYTSLVTRPICIVVITCIWLLSTFIASVQFAWLDPFRHDVNEDLTDDVRKAEITYDIIFLILFFFLPLVFMTIAYTYITVEIIRQSRHIRKYCIPGSEQRNSGARHERKAVPMFAAMLLVYVICWLPYFALRRIDISKLPIPLIYVIVWLRFVASLFNPCVYIIVKQDFRRVIFRRVAKLGQKTNLTSLTKHFYSGKP